MIILRGEQGQDFKKGYFMMWLILALLSGFCAAVLAIIVKIYLKHLNPFFITFFFSIIALIVFLAADLFTKKIHCAQVTSLTFKEWLPLIIAGCLNALAFTCYVGALRCGKTSGVVAIDRLGVLFVVIFSVIFLQESFSVKALIGAGLMVFGAALISA